MNIGAVILKSGKEIVKKYTDSSIENHDQINEKITQIMNTKKCPEGRKLELCTFHTCFSPDDKGKARRKDYDYYLQGINDYAICTTDFKVYDLCYILEEKSKKEKEDFLRLMSEKINKYDHNMEVTYRIHEDFMINIEKRKQLIQKKQEFEKANGSSNYNIQDNPQYILLLQLLQREEDVLENKRNHIEKIYNLKPYEISKEEFIGSFTKDEVEKRDKAKANLDHWCNKNQKTSLTKEQEFLIKIDTAIKSLTDILSKSYEIPCVYVYKATKALDEIIAHLRKDLRHQDLVNKAKSDLEKCNHNFEIYKEFIGDRNIELIVKKVEREQSQAAAEERKNKNYSQNVQKVQAAKNSFVVKLDGSVAKDTSNEPKLVIGGAITSNVEDERWKGLR